MGKKIRKSINGMSWQAKTLLVSAFTLLLTMGMFQGWFHPLSTQADVTTQQNWGAALYNGAASPGNLSFTVNSGSNRVLVVAVTSAINAASATQSCTVSYGGVNLTEAVSDKASSAQQHTWLFYLPDTPSVMDGTAKTLAVTVGNGAKTFVNNMVYAAVFAGVDQSTPLTDSKSYNSGATTVTAPAFASALLENIGDQAVVVANAVRTTATLATTMTAATNWTLTQSATWATTYGIRGGVLNRAVPTTNTSDTAPVTFQAARAALASMCGISLKAAPLNTTLTVSGNTPLASGTRLDTDTGVLMQRLQVQGNGNLTLTSVTMDETGSANNIQNAYIYISGQQQTTLPTDAVLIAQAQNWSGSSTLFDLTAIAGTATARALTGTTPKYLYVVYDMSQGQATKTVASHVTAVGVASPNIGATGLNFSSNTLTLAYSGNMASVTGNTAVAASAKDSDAAVLMQHFQVDSDASFDGALELNSLGIQDLGTVTKVAAVKIYIDTVEQPTLPASAKLIGSISDWNRSATTIPLVNDFGASSADRTVVSGTHKYLYVVYSMNYVDDAVWPSTGKVVQAKVTDVGAASPDAGVTGLSYLSNSITLTRGTWSKITSCGGCHATDTSGPNALQDGTARNVPQGRFPGSHNKHLAYGLTCDRCHVLPTIYKHASGKVDMGGDAAGKYSKGDSFNVSNAPSYGNCSNIYCHSTGTNVSGTPSAPSKSSTWATPLGCNGCHGGANANGAPDYTNGTPKANSHASHTSYSCDTCHYGTTTDGSSIATMGNHANGSYTVGNLGGTISYAMGAVTNGIPAGGTCSSAAGCHNSATWGTTLLCSSCHTGASDVDVFTTGVKGIINTTEWTGTGHGLPSTSRYTDPKRGTGLTGAGFVEKAGAGQDGCLWCHDKTPEHSYSSANPYRLRNNNALGGGWNDACLYCHASTQTNSAYKPVSTFASSINLAAIVKIDKAHYNDSTVNSTSYHNGTRNGGQRCWDCHDPHGDSNIRMIHAKPIKAVSNNAAGAPVMSTPVSTAVVFSNNNLATGAGGFAMTTGSFAQGLCNGCHTYSASAPKMVHYYATGSDAGHNTTGVCTGCHSHNQAFNAAESSGGASCDGCHSDLFSPMNSSTTSYHHYVQNASATYPLAAPTTAEDTNRRCVMCHVDHDVFRPDLNANNTLGRAGNLRTGITAAPDKTKAPGAGVGNYTNTDWNATTGGICYSCHQTAVTKNQVKQKSDGSTNAAVIPFSGGATTEYQNSPHQYNVAATFASGGSTFNANCSKCHSDTNTEKYQSGTITFGTHDSTQRRFAALMGQPAGTTDPMEEKMCYRCHSRITDTAVGGTMKSTTNKDWYGVTAMSDRSELLYNVASNYAFRHDVNATSGMHKPYNEGLAANDGTLSGANRHISCTDCHNPHAAAQIAFANGSGTLTAFVAGTPDTLTDSSKTGASAWTTNQWVGYVVRIVKGTGNGQESVIYANGASTLSAKFGTAPAATSSYIIFKRGTTDGNVISQAPNGVWGLNPTWPAQPTPPAWNDNGGVGGSTTAVPAEITTQYSAISTWNRVSDSTTQGQICIKCHSAYAYGSTPPTTPSGLPNSATAAWGNTVGALTLKQGDKANEFNPNNLAHHAVFARGKNQPVRANFANTGLTSITNASWPKYTGSTIQVVNGVATLSGGTIPKSILPGWFIYIGSITPPTGGTPTAGTGTLALGTGTGFVEIVSVNSNGTYNVRAETGGTWPNPTYSSAITVNAGTACAVTPGLGAAFVPPFGPWSTIRCTDCHASDTTTDPQGPHGSATKYLLKKATTQTFMTINASGVDTVYTLTPTDAYNLCSNCHRLDVYNEYNVTTAANKNYSRQPHPCDTSTGQAFKTLPKWGIICLNCHGGARVGGIHGDNIGVGSGKGGTGTSYSGKRLLAGAYWTGVTRGKVGTAGACYVKGAADSVSNCSNGSDGTFATTTQYTYDDTGF
jgi:predicted CxxxxCH...CXXCH cytochrome family protein